MTLGHLLRSVLDRLRDLSLVSFLPAVPPGRPELRVEVAGQSLSLFDGGACGAGLRATVSEAGAGCIRAEDAAALEALSVDPADWLARNLITTPIPDTLAIDGPGLEPDVGPAGCAGAAARHRADRHRERAG